MSKELSFKRHLGAIWRKRLQGFHMVKELDFCELDSLLFMEKKKEALLKNTRAFLSDLPYSHAVLTGSKGCGKSALVKAIFTHFSKEKDSKLRIISSDNLEDLPYVIDLLRELPYYFILFLDDLSFSPNDASYKALKPLLEGSIEAAPKNIVIYATSNYRQIALGSVDENERIDMHDLGDERLALRERFGLWLSFYHYSMDEFYSFVEFYYEQTLNLPCFAGKKGKELRKNKDKDLEEVKAFALAFANERGSRSPRLAKQFCELFLQE